MTKRRPFLLTGSALALASVLPGVTLAQTQPLSPNPSLAALPAEVAAEMPGAQWAGSARLRFFGFDVYDSRLWVAPGFKAAQFDQHGLALELSYLRALSGRDIAERSLKARK